MNRGSGTFIDLGDPRRFGPGKGKLPDRFAYA